MIGMNKKNILFWTLRIVIFFALLIVLWKALNHFRPYLLNLVSEYVVAGSLETEDTNNAIAFTLFGLLSLAASTAFTTFITKVVESFFTSPESVPEVLVTCPQNKDKNLSGYRLRHDYDQNICINIGNQKNPFRIVYAQIKNTGENVVLEVSINRQVIASVLEHGESKGFFFIVHEPNNVQSISYHEFTYSVRNSGSDIYVGKYQMIIDRNLSKATFNLQKKLKRSILRDAISNLRSCLYLYR